MKSSNDVMLSVKERFAKLIIDGSKTVELRKRLPKIDPGSRIWIYSKLPTGTVRAYARLSEIVQFPPDRMWRSRANELGLSRKEFDDYFSERPVAYGLVLSEVTIIRDVALDELRACDARFHPPQFMLRLRPGTPTHSLLIREIEESVSPAIYT